MSKDLLINPHELFQQPAWIWKPPFWLSLGSSHKYSYIFDECFFSPPGRADEKWTWNRPRTKMVLPDPSRFESGWDSFKRETKREPSGFQIALACALNDCRLGKKGPEFQCLKGGFLKNRGVCWLNPEINRTLLHSGFIGSPHQTTHLQTGGSHFFRPDS